MQFCDDDSIACWKRARRKPERDCWGLTGLGSVSSTHGVKKFRRNQWLFWWAGAVREKMGQFSRA